MSLIVLGGKTKRSKITGAKRPKRPRTKGKLRSTRKRRRKSSSLKIPTSVFKKIGQSLSNLWDNKKGKRRRSSRSSKSK